MSAKKRGLGRGFSSLIPDELFDESFDPTAAQDDQVSELRNIKIEEIIPDPQQPRRNFDEAALEMLAVSIKEHGVLQPIVVVPKNGGYMIVAGERRWRASTRAGLAKIPALVRTLSAQHKLELSLIENLQRSDLNPLETATAYLKLRDQFNLSLEEIAKRMGVRSVSTVSNKMRLLKLPKIIQKAVAELIISEGQARPLIGLDADVAEKLLQSITQEGWSVRKIEQMVVQLKGGGGAKPASHRTPTLHDTETKRIAKRLGSKVKISSNAKGSGRITISFKDAEDLQRLETLLAGDK